ncbi:hypothetical protein AXF42_Ash008803 [Apostasia shenzhenica]|uniref:Uncharacterized protein n=1 Tax=Apostasia shenzhenica TaxID=1088818 RepID=A0A2I0ASQ4_9ASPA|nr:hypothetical protein AXF42_Ash008803 [Apostasia shenzhenica]
MMRKCRSIESLSSLSRTKSCVCSPTNHVGSFRCRHHRQQLNQSTSSSPVGTTITIVSLTQDVKSEVRGGK